MFNYHTSTVRTNHFVPSSNVRNFGDPETEKAEALKLKRNEVSFLADQAEKLKNHKITSTHDSVNSTIERGVALLSSVFEHIVENSDGKTFEPDSFMTKNIEEFNIMAQNDSNFHETTLKMMEDFDLHQELFANEQISPKLQAKLKKNNAIILRTPEELDDLITREKEKPVLKEISDDQKSTLTPEDKRSQLIKSVAEAKIYLPSSILRTKKDLHYDHDYYNSLTTDQRKYLAEKYEFSYYDDDDNFNVKMFGRQNILFTDRLTRLRLSRQYGKYVYNIDDLVHFNSDYDKFKFIKYHSMMTNNWRPYNNYFRELTTNYRLLFKEKILIADSPNQINKSLYYSSKNLIVFELKTDDYVFTKREELDNIFLKTLKNPKYNMKYEYMMYFLFSFFKRDDYEDNFKSDG
jgi:hypothetical protein